MMEAGQKGEDEEEEEEQERLAGKGEEENIIQKKRSLDTQRCLEF